MYFCFSLKADKEQFKETFRTQMGDRSPQTSRQIKRFPLLNRLSSHRSSWSARTTRNAREKGQKREEGRCRRARTLGEYHLLNDYEHVSCVPHTTTNNSDFVLLSPLRVRLVRPAKTAFRYYTLHFI